MALTLIVLGVLILFDRLHINYGVKEGWPWLVVALGAGGLFKNSRNVPAWITMIIGLLVVGAKYYSIRLYVPNPVKAYFLPVLLIVVGFVWMWKYRKN